MRHVFNKIANLATEAAKQPLKRVDLSMFDDIEDALGRVYSGEFVQDALDEAYSKFILAKDIVRFDMNDAFTEAESLIEDLEEELKEMGEEDHPKLKEYKSQLEDARQEVEDYERKIDQFLR